MIGRRHFLKAAATSGILSLAGCADSSSRAADTDNPAETVAVESVTSTPTDTPTLISIDEAKVATESVPLRPYNYYPYVAGKYKVGARTKWTN